jgi:basic membrane protein A and related proteins
LFIMIMGIIITACTNPPPQKVCVVLDTGGENDKSFNQYTLQGARDAAEATGLEFAHVVSVSENGYASSIRSFVEEDCGLIVTVGFLMGDATAEAARNNPDTQFAIIDVAYFPGFGCDEDAADCYSEEGGLSNVTSLTFAEDEVGYLAGTLAACMSQTDIIGSVSGMEIPPVVRFVTGYQNGAKAFNPDIETINVYIPDFNDPTGGKEFGEIQIGQGADVIFGVGGNTGNAGMLAAYEAGVMAIGVDVDQYETFPDIASSIITSAQKNVDVAINDAVTAYADGTLEGGIQLSTVENNGIGLAPYHDWEDKIPDACDTAVSEARQNLIDGTVTTGMSP